LGLCDERVSCGARFRVGALGDAAGTRGWRSGWSEVWRCVRMDAGHGQGAPLDSLPSTRCARSGQAARSGHVGCEVQAALWGGARASSLRTGSRILRITCGSRMTETMASSGQLRGFGRRHRVSPHPLGVMCHPATPQSAQCRVFCGLLSQNASGTRPEHVRPLAHISELAGRCRMRNPHGQAALPLWRRSRRRARTAEVKAVIGRRRPCGAGRGSATRRGGPGSRRAPSQSACRRGLIWARRRGPFRAESGWSTRTDTTSGSSHGSVCPYARHPLLGTVGLDRTFYRPESARDLRELARDLPRASACSAA
jgi:hypothetical protein